ncbi:membrane transporter [Malassezia pachydermatis]|uniref:Membrane transporter n=1 Tax=Malassezia pachydermatis TaxID=77020 RepID=A0A0M8MNK2_9BASI|nr:membrane transporter [Malassezia pachydermatis]KOS15168.1 membrane transporter [Malassezia pachydermatis]
MANERHMPTAPMMERSFSQSAMRHGPGSATFQHGDNEENNGRVINFDKPDDEYVSEDRGEALIRHRIRERRREKWLKQRERELEQESALSTTSEGTDIHSKTMHRPGPSTSYRDTPMRHSMLSDAAGCSMGREYDSAGESEHAGHVSFTDMMDDSAIQESIDENELEDDLDENDLEYTVKDRQDALNIEHPFGLPIWKPALYKKSRSIQRTANSAVRSMPGLHTDRASWPGNLLWCIVFGVWLSLLCFICSGILYFVPKGGIMYSHTLYGLGTYILWPFGNYVEVECSHAGGHRHGPCRLPTVHEHEVNMDEHDDAGEVPDENTPLNSEHPHHSLYSGVEDDTAESPLSEKERISQEKKLYHYVFDENGNDVGVPKRIGGIIVYALLYIFVLFPALGLVCLLCWSFVFTIPMAKVSWLLLKNMAKQPLALHFRSPLHIDTRVLKVKDSDEPEQMRQVLHPGNLAPRIKRQHRKKGTSKRRSTILLCTYKAMGREYFKYTVGGVNILFVNTVPVVFFTIILFFLVRPYCLRHGLKEGLLGTLISDGLIFGLSLASVMPLSYFIGMAVASISTQSSIGMGAVINATFGSIIELILYSLALTEGKASLVEGSIIGSILAGVLLMPGTSMCSGAMRRKEQKFNSRSAGVTSTMLIMAIIGILTPTLFYHIYGKFEMACSGCPNDVNSAADSWKCDQCSFQRMSPLDDPFFQTNVKGLVYACAVVLLLAYGIGLWFSLRTHASQIWNSTPNIGPEAIHPLHRAAMYKRLLHANEEQSLPLHQDAASQERMPTAGPSKGLKAANAAASAALAAKTMSSSVPDLPSDNKPTSSAPEDTAKPKLSPEDALADAAARMYQYIFSQQKQQPSQDEEETENEGGGGHDGPSWSRGFSLSVLLGCTVLYAVIAEIIVDLVDVVINGSGLSAKFVGVTIFALVPNTTEFMNAMSFALNGNIALSLEIGSAYALQVCLIQIPVLVGFSALYNSSYMPQEGFDMAAHSFTLLFPRWDIIAIVFSIFLLTYTYNEARSNYHRGSILVLAYVVFVLGFFFAPDFDPEDPAQAGVRRFPA